MLSDWPHQITAVSESIRRIEEGASSICVTSPTGGGKSRIIQRLCEWACAQNWTVAVFTNRKLLTAQLARGLANNGIHVGVRAAEFESWSDPTAPVQICSTPTETSRVIRARERAIQRLATEEEAHRDHQLAPAQLVIIDEVHINCADGMMQIVSEYREKHRAIVIGITATPLGVSHMLDELIVAGNMTSLRECGALVLAECYEPAVIDLPKIRKSKQEIFTQKEFDNATKAVWSQHIVGMVYDHWKKLNPGALPALGMAPGVKESIGLAQEFARHGVSAAHIDGTGIFVDGEYHKTSKQEDRDEIFARSKSGDIKVIFNRYVLREAIDLPFLEHMILATPIASPLSYVQTVGRVLRASPATQKTKAIITDHAGSIRLHGSPNMDRDKDWLQYFYESESKLQRDRQNALRDPEKKEPEPITCPECGMIRRKGPICQKCGYECKASSRRVIQEDGTLKHVAGDVFPRRKTKMKPDTCSLWERCYHRMRNARKPKTFGQAYGLFVRENHYQPPRDLPLMPKDPRDWTRRIIDVPRDCLIQRG